MEFREWDRPGGLLAELEAAGTTYGPGGFSGLLSPASLVLDAGERRRLAAAPDAVWSWIATCQKLYAQLLAGEPGHPLVRALEWGLPPAAVTVQRAEEGAPLVGRLDAVTPGRIAEVQWKGGGEGFLAGVERAHRAVGPQWSDARPVGDLLAGFAGLFRPGLVVGVGRPVWRSSTRLLADALAAAGVRLVAVPKAELADRLRVRGAAAEVRDDDGRWARADVVWSDRLAELLPAATLTGLAGLARAGGVRLDPPPSYLYVHKVCLAVPFLAGFAAYFPAEVPAGLIPSALVTRGPADPGPVAAALTGAAAERLGALRDWDQLVALPRSVREQLVLKCASADPELSSQGRGVRQLGGSRTVAARSWAFVRHRVLSTGEPWLLQPYVSRRYVAPLSHPDSPDRIERREVHARIAAFGAAGTGLLGGVGNVGPFWKVAGKDAGRDARGQLTGSAFVDLRATG